MHFTGPSTRYGDVHLQRIRAIRKLRGETGLPLDEINAPLASMGHQDIQPIGGEALLGIAFKPIGRGLYEDFLIIDFTPPPEQLLPRRVLSVRGEAVAKP